MRQRNAITAASLALLLTLTACAVNPATGRREFSLVSESQEIAMGHEYDPQIVAQMGLYPDEVGRFAERILEFTLALTEAQIKAADGMLDGMVIWGDIAYKKDMFFSPAYWRKYYKPGLKAMIDLCHENDLMVIYHGCGNVKRPLLLHQNIQAGAINQLHYQKIIFIYFADIKSFYQVLMIKFTSHTGFPQKTLISNIVFDQSGKHDL